DHPCARTTRTRASASRSTTTPTSTPRASRTSSRTRPSATSAPRAARCRTRCEAAQSAPTLIDYGRGSGPREVHFGSRGVVLDEEGHLLCAGGRNEPDRCGGSIVPEQRLV